MLTRAVAAYRSWNDEGRGGRFEAKGIDDDVASPSLLSSDVSGMARFLFLLWTKVLSFGCAGSESEDEEE